MKPQRQVLWEHSSQTVWPGLSPSGSLFGAQAEGSQEGSRQSWRGRGERSEALKRGQSGKEQGLGESRTSYMDP